MKRLIFALMLWPSVAFSDDTTFWMTANDLLTTCESNQPEFRAFCIGYVIGASDGARDEQLLSRVFANHESAVKNCMPAEVTRKQATDIVIQYIVNNPTARHYRAASQVSMALHEAFPCE